MKDTDCVLCNLIADFTPCLLAEFATVQYPRVDVFMDLEETNADTAARITTVIRIAQNALPLNIVPEEECVQTHRKDVIAQTDTRETDVMYVPMDEVIIQFAAASFL